MKIIRAIIAGAILWSLIFLSFTFMSFIPQLKHSEDLQNVIILIINIPFITLVNYFFYKNRIEWNSFKLGSVIILTCLILDAVITLPLVIIPKGGTYLDFFWNIGIVIMGIEILLISILYSRLKKTKPILK